MSTQIKELEKSLKDSAISNKKDFLKLYQKFMRKTNEQVIFQELHRSSLIWAKIANNLL